MPASAPEGFWTGKRVLVTGATGFLGSWLVEKLLDRQAMVVALIRDMDRHSRLLRGPRAKDVHVINGNLEDYLTVERAIVQHGVDTVIHLGAQAIVGVAQRSPLATFESNIRGTYHVLDACRRHSESVRRIVVASSDKAYGDHATLPYTEDTPLRPRNPYDASKSCCDLIAQTYGHSYQLPVAIARCGNLFGGGDLHWSRLIPGTIRSILHGKRPVIRSDGEYIRDYLYVEDAAEAFIRLGESVDENLAGEAFNFSLEHPIKAIEMVDLIRERMDARHLDPDVQNTAVGEIREQWLTSAKARKQLCWSPAHTLGEAIDKTIDWYRTQS